MEANVTQDVDKAQFQVDYVNAQRVTNHDDVRPLYWLEASSEFLSRKLMPYTETFDTGITPFLRLRQYMADTEFVQMMQQINAITERTKEWPQILRLQQLFNAGSMKYLRGELKGYIGRNSMLPLENEMDYYRAIHWIFLRFWEPFVVGTPDVITQATEIGEAVRGYTASQITQLVSQFSPVLQNWDREVSERMAQFLKVVPTLVPAYSFEFYRGANKDPQDIVSEYGLSTARFEDIKGLYQDLFETIFRLSPLIVANNNIIHRGDLNAMPPGFGRTDTVEAYSNLRTAGNKIEKLRAERPKEALDGWIELPLSTTVRNAVGHANWSYDPVHQHISYGTGEGNYLLEFAIEIPRLLRTMIGLWELMYRVREMDYISHGTMPSLDFSRLLGSLSSRKEVRKGPRSKKSIQKQNRKKSRRQH